MLIAVQAKGNAAFTSGKFEEAIGHFTEAIGVDPTNHVFYSNRSACQVRSGRSLHCHLRMSSAYGVLSSGVSFVAWACCWHGLPQR